MMMAACPYLLSPEMLILVVNPIEEALLAKLDVSKVVLNF